MIKAVVIKEDGYRCAPEGHTVVFYPQGASLTGKAAELALEDGAAEPLENKARAVPENKATPRLQKPLRSGFKR